RDRLRAHVWRRCDERDRRSLAIDPVSENERDRFVDESSTRERENTQRRRVGPLDVIDPDRDRTAGSQRTKGADRREADRSRVRTRTFRGPDEQGGLERSTLPKGEILQDLTGDRFEQVPEDRERERRLRFPGAGLETVPPRAPEPGRLSPDRRLSDPGFALDDQRSRAGRIGRRESHDVRELALS